MKVFISWSGERSKRVAELLDDWIQCVIQAVEPWMSSKDIDRGALWFTEISDQLSITSIGIVCLTKENKNKPWILFEAGALAKGLSSNRVCTVLVDLKSTDLENPLAQLNHTFPERESIWGLVRTINLSLKDGALKEEILLKVFETYWPQFESEFKNIIKSTPDIEIQEQRGENDIILEVLTTVRHIDKRLRNVESNRDFNTLRNSEDMRRDRLPSGEAKKIIRQSLESGISKEIIFDLLEEQGVPKGFIINEFNKIDDESSS